MEKYVDHRNVFFLGDRNTKVKEICMCRPTNPPKQKPLHILNATVDIQMNFFAEMQPTSAG
jgi:hypothetical protein